MVASIRRIIQRALAVQLVSEGIIGRGVLKEHLFGSRTSAFVFSTRSSSSFSPWIRAFDRRDPKSSALADWKVRGGNLKGEMTQTDGGVGSGEKAVAPVARREEDRFVLAGKLEGDLRQSENSEYPLLDPAQRVKDPYGWIRDDAREREEVLAHVRAENAHTEAVTAHLGGLRERLYQELLGCIQETDHTVPTPYGDYVYYSRTYEGKSYAAHCRAPHQRGAGHVAVTDWDGKAETPIMPGEDIYLDENKLAEGKDYCDAGAVEVSPSQKLVAYSVDYTGDEVYGMYVVDAMDPTRVIDHDSSLECDGSVEWGKEDSTLFYIKKDDAKRPFQVYRRILPSADNPTPPPDEMLFEDKDDLFYVYMSKSQDERYLFICSSSSETGEVHYLDLHDPNATLQCVARRRFKVLYDVEHHNGHWIITTNVQQTPNMRLMTCPATSDCQDEWKDLVDSSTDQKLFDGSRLRGLDSVCPFKGHLVAVGREESLPRVWVITLGDGEALTVTNFHRLAFDEEAYDAGLGRNYEFDTSKVVVAYDSLVTPLQYMTVDMNDPTQRTVLKKRNVPGYDKDLYGCERTTVKSRDGKVQIPVSLVYRKDLMAKHMETGQPVNAHLYGYGSYGIKVEADFESKRLPLLNRDVVYVLAHIRGGGEMGRHWYEEPDGAKYLCKKNTFNDFVDVARWLIEDRKLTVPDKLSCEGRSAGGLLIGATLNQAPELFSAALLGVPFLDIVCTMVDATIPLTCGEWEEWGNPNEERYFSYMSSYDPMRTVKQGAKYPSCLLTGGLHDPRVQYWEPLKFAAELRHVQDPASGVVCVKMEMNAGHMSASDRYKYLRELAFDLAFLVDQLGLPHDSKSM